MEADLHFKLYEVTTFCSSLTGYFRRVETPKGGCVPSTMRNFLHMSSQGLFVLVLVDIPDCREIKL